ncbi:MAG: methyltransferase domain-containing protein [Candidatus Acidiferrales bacterium]
MSDGTVQVSVSGGHGLSTPKDKSRLLRVIQYFVRDCRIDRNQPVLVIGGSHGDLEILSICGFKQIVMSNLDANGLFIDAEDIALPDDSYSVVFAHAVLHHCRCPLAAVGEMVRVSQKHVVFVEPNDSWSLRMLVRLGFSFPYELAAVADNEYTHGGMRNGPIPNYIYRFTGHEIKKAVCAYHPERQFRVNAHPYWDFYVNEHELLVRTETRVAKLARKLGPARFIALLHSAQKFLNLFSPVRSQGNKFFCSISKATLHPWIELRDGQYVLRRETNVVGS